MLNEDFVVSEFWDINGAPPRGLRSVEAIVEIHAQEETRVLAGGHVVHRDDRSHLGKCVVAIVARLSPTKWSQRK